MADTLTIDHVGQRGDGVVLGDGAPRYAPYTLAGERVTAEPMGDHPDRYRLTSVDRASAERIEPFCPYFGTCGGCAIQHWQPEQYRAWKRQIVVDTLRQASIDAAVDDIVDAHGLGRRRVTLHARFIDGSVRVGFAAAGSHTIIAIDHCPILDPALAGAVDAARALAETLQPVGKPLDIQVTATSGGLDIDIRGSGALAARAITVLSSVAERHKLARLTRHGELVLLRAPPVVTMGACVTLPPGSFLQATVAGEETLAALVMEHCRSAKRVVDLFCGVGPFALRLAARARVAAFDNAAGAIAALQEAAKMPGLRPITAEARDLFRRPLVPQELRDVDAVVFDPPRQGAQAQAVHLARSKVPVVVAISCNAATFARDARILTDGGYRLARVTPIDQFRHTPHVELVGLFEK